MGSNQYRKFVAIGMVAADLLVAGQIMAQDAPKPARKAKPSSSYKRGGSPHDAPKMRIEVDPIYIPADPAPYALDSSAVRRTDPQK